MMDKKNYQQAIERLEEIMNAIQNGGMDIDGLEAALKEAASLVQICRNKLFEVDEKVKSLLDDIGDGQF